VTPGQFGFRIFLLSVFVLWTLFCLYGAGTGLLNLFPISGEEPFTERLLRLGLRVTLWGFIWFLPMFVGLVISLAIGRREKPADGSSR